MVRGTFANIRLRNRIVEGVEGGFTRHFPDGEQMTIYDASMRYQADGVPLVVIAGKEYGSGSSRDWAAKGSALLGVRAVIAESYERIHRTNLVALGVIPLQFLEGESAESLGITGTRDVHHPRPGRARGRQRGDRRAGRRRPQLPRAGAAGHPGRRHGLPRGRPAADDDGRAGVAERERGC